MNGVTGFDAGIVLFVAFLPLNIVFLADHLERRKKLEIERIEKEIELEKFKWRNRAGKLTQPIQED